MRDPVGSEEETLVAGLEDSWAAHLTTVDGWRQAFDRQSAAAAFHRGIVGSFQLVAVRLAV